MPQFVEKATTYGYGKASPYLDTACEKVPLVQSVVKVVVPYAKPSIEFADKIVDKALDLTSKPVEIAQSKISSISAMALNFKAAITSKLSSTRDIASDKLSTVKVSASKTLEKFKALVVEKKAMVLKYIMDTKTVVYSKFQELKDKASKKGSEVKTLAIDTKNKAYSKGSAGKAYVVDVVEKVPGKAYSAATQVAGKARVDSVIEKVEKYVSSKEVAKKEK